MERGRGVGHNTPESQTQAARQLGDSEKYSESTGLSCPIEVISMGDRKQRMRRIVQDRHFVQLPFDKVRITKDRPNLDKDNS